MSCRKPVDWLGGRPSWGRASNALDGRLEEATRAMAQVRRLNPALRLSNLKDLIYPIRRPEDFDKWEVGLRLAGLPE
jgi:hypothetical protein